MNARVERHPPVIIPKGQKLKALRDEIIVKALEWSPSSVITIAGSKRKTLRGTIVSVGPGTWHNVYNGPKGYRTKYRASKRFQPTELKVGDTVELGGLELGGYLFQEIIIDNQLHVRCREGDVVGVHV